MPTERFLPQGETVYPGFIDNHIRKHGKWMIYGRSFASYLGDFYALEEVGAKENVNAVVSKLQAKERPVIIDLLAPVNTLLDLATHELEGKPLKAVAVGLKDEHDLDLIERCKEKGITYIAGDLRDVETWDKITDWLGNDKADLVMSRGAGGLRYLRTHPDFYAASSQRIWNMLNPSDGTALLQLPPQGALQKREIPIAGWAKRVNQLGIPLKYVPGYPSPSDAHEEYSVLFFEKRQDTVLPVCPSRKTIHKKTK